MAEDRKKPQEPFYKQRGQAAADASIHGVNPAFLIETILRERILDSLYYKDQCFGLTAATILDRITELTYVGGSYGSGKPTAFISLILKLLQLLPSREIILAYLHDATFKYLRIAAAFYVRLTFPAKLVYETLEPLLTDRRKIRVRTAAGSWRLDTVDGIVDTLLTESRVFDVALPNLMARGLLEDMDELETRISPLQAELDGESDSEDEAGDDG